MKHRSSQIIFGHWNELREQRALPERADIDPTQIRGALADSFILSYDTVAGHPLRLAGTRLCALLGQELRDAPLVSFWRSNERPGLERLLAAAVDDSIGVVAAVTARCEDLTTLDLELLLLPLKHGGKTHLRLIGSLAPITAPAWPGALPLRGLRLGDYRYLNYAAPVQAPGIQPSVPPDRIRHGLAVYDGGRS